MSASEEESSALVRGTLGRLSNRLRSTIRRANNNNSRGGGGGGRGKPEIIATFFKKITRKNNIRFLTNAFVFPRNVNQTSYTYYASFTTLLNSVPLQTGNPVLPSLLP